jgi:hypothetical protein
LSVALGVVDLDAGDLAVQAVGPRAATMIVVPALEKSTPGLRACQQRLVHVELLGQQLQRRAVAEGRQLGHGLVVVLGDVGRERARRRPAR